MCAGKQKGIGLLSVRQDGGLILYGLCAMVTLLDLWGTLWWKA